MGPLKMKTALLIDGGYLRAESQSANKTYNPQFIQAFAHSCIDPTEYLLRVLYYDARPYVGSVQLPVSGGWKRFQSHGAVPPIARQHPTSFGFHPTCRFALIKLAHYRNFCLVDFGDADARVMRAMEGLAVFRRVAHPSMTGMHRITHHKRALQSNHPANQRHRCIMHA